MFEKISNKIGNEPVRVGQVLIAGVLLAISYGLLPQLIEALRSYNYNITPQLETAVNTFITILALVLGGEGIRQFTVSYPKIQRETREQFMNKVE